MKRPVSIYDGTMTDEDIDLMIATEDQDGLMSKEDKKKLNSLTTGGDGSATVDSLEASKVVQDATHRFVTDTQISTWDAKATTDKADSSKDGLMSKEDKTKLDGIAAEANKYEHPENHPATMITEDTDHKFVTDAEKAKWNAKADTTEVSTETNGLMSFADKVKLDGIATNANNYVHPENHEATMITEDETHRFVTDAEKEKWNALPADKTAIGLENVTNDAQVKRSEMGVADGVATLDSTGKVPSSQLPSFVDDVLEYDNFDGFPPEGESGKIYLAIDTNKTYRWSSSTYVEIPTSVALGETESTAYAGNKGKANADEIAKIKDGSTVVPKATDAATVSGHTVEVNVPADAKFTDTTYTHPDSHPATMITEDGDHKFVTDVEKAKWNAKAETTAATTEANGLMSKEDKKKLDGISAEANKYEHPANHPATMITEDETHKFVTDTEKSTWNAKADTTVASGEANGLMSSTDKTKLDGIEEGANKYVHPDNHEATMITEDTDHKFVTDTQIAKWDAKADTTVASGEANGLMSSTDKTKLDELVGVPTNFEMLRENNYINLKYGNPKELKAKFYIPKAQFSGSTCFIADELATFYDDLGGAPTSYDMKPWAEAGKTVEDLTAENGPYLVLTANYLGEDLGEESTLELEQYVTSLKPYFEAYMKSAEFNSKEFPELETTSKTIIGAINELKTAIDALKA